MSRIALPRTLVNQLLHHAQRAPEDEVCGLIGAAADGAMRLYPVANVAEDAHHLFIMEPKGQIDAMRQMRQAGETLFAIYHSHPHAPAAPSSLDLQQAAYPEALYLIVSLDTQGVLEMRGYRLHDGAVENIELELLEGQ
ncbi:MAG TPA: M67 family metallopeptidase [Gammaproteobacteria bacterium]